MEHDNHAIERLTALMAAGYEIQPVGRPEGAVVLHFPGRRFKYWCAYVYSSGQAVLLSSSDDERRFYADDTQDDFRQFLTTVPRPHWIFQAVRIPGIVHVAWVSITTIALVLHFT